MISTPRTKTYRAQITHSLAYIARRRAVRLASIDDRSGHDALIPDVLWLHISIAQSGYERCQRRGREGMG
jgi:hypothetical protein